MVLQDGRDDVVVPQNDGNRQSIIIIHPVFLLIDVGVGEDEKLLFLAVFIASLGELFVF